MAVISKVARLLNGVIRNIDLAASGNGLQVDELQVGSTSPASLTKTILTNLIALQNGSDFADGTNAHTHDGRYFTETELGGSGGSALIGDDDTYTNFTPTGATIKGALEGIDAAIATAGETSFSDSDFLIYDNGDATKQLAFEVSSISAATTRTITMPDANVDLGQIATAIQRDGSVAFTADQSMGGNRITNLSDPSSAGDAATKNYVDTVALGLRPKEATRVGTVADIDLSSMPATIDGITLVSGDRILVKDQADPTENGIYDFNGAGSAATRSLDMDSLTPVDEINGAWVPVQEGTQAGRVYVQYGSVTTIGTDPINFEFYNPLAALVGGDMITVSGSNIAVDLLTNGGLKSSNPGNAGGQLQVALEASNPSLRVTGSNELGVKLDVAAAITSGSGGLAVQVDATTIEISGNALRVKDLGITSAKLADDAVITSKILDANVTTDKIADDAVTAAKIASDVAGAGLQQEASGALSVNSAYVTLTNANAGTLNAGTVVRISADDSFDAADADDIATCVGTIGVLLANTATGVAGKIQVAGIATPTGGGAYTAGTRVYLSGTAGSTTSTAPDTAPACVVLIGIAVNATQVALQPTFVGENE